METKINIAAILKDKPKGIELYSPIFGKCKFKTIYEHTCKGDTDSIGVKVNYSEVCLDEAGKYIFNGILSHDDREPLLFPSKEMRDWSKFAWKKGDLLVNSCGFQCIFKEWASDDYTKFNGCYSTSRYGYKDVSNAKTANFAKLDNNIAYGYVREIERKLGGKLNLETLEIEKSQTQFKDGDVITITPHIGDKLIYLFKSEDDEKYYGHAFLDGNIAIINEDSYCQKDFCTARLSTEEEQKQLFDGLAKKHVYWDCEHKEIIDMNVKVELKPFDRVLVWCGKWIPDVFGYRNDDGQFICIGGGGFDKVIPYEGNEHLLGTTKDVEG